jgi:hypothetical protein
MTETNPIVAAIDAEIEFHETRRAEQLEVHERAKAQLEAAGVALEAADKVIEHLRATREQYLGGLNSAPVLERIAESEDDDAPAAEPVAAEPVHQEPEPDPAPEPEPVPAEDSEAPEPDLTESPAERVRKAALAATGEFTVKWAAEQAGSRPEVARTAIANLVRDGKLDVVTPGKPGRAGTYRVAGEAPAEEPEQPTIEEKLEQVTEVIAEAIEPEHPVNLPDAGFVPVSVSDKREAARRERERERKEREEMAEKDVDAVYDAIKTRGPILKHEIAMETGISDNVRLEAAIKELLHAERVVDAHDGFRARRESDSDPEKFLREQVLGTIGTSVEKRLSSQAIVNLIGDVNVGRVEEICKQLEREGVIRRRPIFRDWRLADQEEMADAA